MLILNMVFWLFLTSSFYLLREGLAPESNDLITTNEFIPSNYDTALALLVGGLIIIWLWHRLSLQFLDTWQVLSSSPIQLWALKNLGIWGYGLLGVFFVPQLIFIIAVPGLFILEKIDVHLGDFIMPTVISATSAVLGFMF